MQPLNPDDGAPVERESVDLPVSRDEALRLLADAAARWGGDSRVPGSETPENSETSRRAGQGHDSESSKGLEGVEEAEMKLVLPVQAGLRHGALLINATTLRLGDGAATRLELEVERAEFRVRRANLLVLGLGLAGGLLIVVMPLLPELVSLLPLSFAFLLLAWFLVLARVRYQGLREFVTALEELAKASAE